MKPENFEGLAPVGVQSKDSVENKSRDIWEDAQGELAQHLRSTLSPEELQEFDAHILNTEGRRPRDLKYVKEASVEEVMKLTKQFFDLRNAGRYTDATPIGKQIGAIVEEAYNAG